MKLNKKLLTGLSIGSLILIGTIGFWLGSANSRLIKKLESGKKISSVVDKAKNTDSKQSVGDKRRSKTGDSKNLVITAYQKELEKNPNQPLVLFNLAVHQFKAGNLKEAKDNFSRLLNSSNPDFKLLTETLDNLGQTSYLLANQEKDVSKKQQLLQKSLLYYRDTFSEAKYKGSSADYLKQIEHNIILVKLELGKLKETEKKKNLQKETEKSIYQLLDELVKLETEINSSLKKADDNFNLRTELLKKRDSSLKKLSILKNRLMKLEKVPGALHRSRK